MHNAATSQAAIVAAAMAAGAPPPPAGVVRTSRAVGELTGTGPWTISDIDIGAADASKVVGIGLYAGMTSGTLGVTQDGTSVPGVIVAPSGTRHLNYYEFLEPTKTLFDLVITPSAAGQWLAYEVFTVTGQSTPGWTDRSDTVPTVGASNTVLAAGVTDVTDGTLFAGGMYNANSGIIDWSPDGTETYNQQVGGGPTASFLYYTQVGSASINPTATQPGAATLMRAFAVAHSA